MIREGARVRDTRAYPMGLGTATGSPNPVGFVSVLWDNGLAELVSADFHLINA